MHTASREGGNTKFHNEKLIIERIARWENGGRGTLWNAAVLSKAAKKARETSSQNANKMVERAKTLCHQGFFGEAAKNLSSDELASSNEKTYEYLCYLHPKEKEPILLPATDEMCLGYKFSERVVSDMLSSFPKGTAAGPSIMYPEHLSNAIRCNNPEQSRIEMQISPA